MTLTVLLLCLGLTGPPGASSPQAALFDELTPLFPDSTPDTGEARMEYDVPRGVPAGVHVLVTGLPPEASVRWNLRSPTGEAGAARAYRLLTVPVEQNTGLESRTEVWDGKVNTHVIRRAPFRVFEALEPVGATTAADPNGTLALRIEVPIAAEARPGVREYVLELAAGDWRQALAWTVQVHGITVPPVSPDSRGYTNWFSSAVIAERFRLEPWSEPFWEMLGQHADLMVRGRQNTFLVPWADFARVTDGQVVVDRPRLVRYMRLFLSRGFTRIEGGHLAGRHADDWTSPRLDFVLTGQDLSQPEAKAALAVLLSEIRALLDELHLPPEIQYVQHLADEPTEANADSYRTLAEFVRRQLPGIRIFEATISRKLVGVVDLWCPQVQEYQKSREFFEQRRTAGDQVWVYTCLIPGGPWLNRLLDQERLRPVYLGWALAKYDLAGFLHWGFNHWRGGTDPFETTVVPHGAGPPNFLPAGDSHVVFPGRNGPLSGQRFEAQRIGLEDAELLRMLRRADRGQAEQIIARVFRAFDDFEKDVRAYRAARRLLLAALAALEPQSPPVLSQRWTFDDEKQLEGWTRKATGEAEKRMPQPKLENTRLYLLESWEKSTGAVAAKSPAETFTRSVEIEWLLVMNTGTEGLGFLWLDTATHGADANIPEVERWEAPSVPRAFGIGLDALNPPNRDPFRGAGNVMDRPQHEISLHWDNLEIVKRATPRDFRNEQPHRVRARIVFVTGGAEVTLWLDDDPVFERYLIASMTAYLGRPAFGARNGDTAGDVMLDDVGITLHKPIEPPAPPVSIVAIDHQLNDAAHPRNEATAVFPDNTDTFGRIICTLRLDKPETRFDPWDRIAHVWVHDDAGERYELLRYITPYHRGHVWQVDVSDFRPLLRGSRKIVQECGTQGEGWVVTVAFDFYPGPAARYATRIVPLWSGAPEIGNPDQPASDFYVPRAVPLDPGTQQAKVRMVVTGHGMTPNANNAGEFMPIGRTLRINGQSFYNVLWKTDNYLNPCRPQGGTWKYDRAGWAPGDVVRPWEVDVPPLPASTRELRIEYILDPYVNENRGKTWAPTHVTEAQLIVYEPVPSSSSARPASISPASRPTADR